MKKGFTLIELLSVIVILAIISLIAIPSLTKVVSNVKLKADLESVRGYINAADAYYMKAQYDSDLYDTLGTNVIDKLPVKGEKLTGSVIINTNGLVEVAIIKNNRCYKKSASSQDIEVLDKDECSNSKNIIKSYSGRLHVCENNLCNSKGDIVRIIGASSGGLHGEKVFDIAEVNKESIKTLKSWGANGLRVFITANIKWVASYIGNEDLYITRLKRVIDDAIANDMYVIVNWDPAQNNGDPLTDKAKEALTRIANLYPNDPHIMYELWNEPEATKTWNDIKTHTAKVLPAIRAISPDSIIFIGSPEANKNLSIPLSDPLNYKNIMYSHHMYMRSITNISMNGFNAAMKAKLPVFVTEWGSEGDGNDSPLVVKPHAYHYINLLNKYNLSYMFFGFQTSKDVGADRYGIVKESNWTDDLPDSILKENGKFLKEILTGKKFDVKDSILMENRDVTGDTNLTYRSGEWRDKIKTIKFKSTLSVPSNVVKKWDLSLFQDGTVIGYLESSGEKDRYNLTIATNGFVYAPKISRYLFAGLTNLESIDFTNFKTDNVTNIEGMFMGDTNLKSLDLSGFNTSQINTMYATFRDCNNLVSINFTGWNPKVKEIYNLFTNCYKLESVDLSGFDVSNVKDLGAVFSNCYALKELNLSTWETSDLTKVNYLFANCRNLSSIDISKLNIISTTTSDKALANLKTGAKIIVKNQAAIDKLNPTATNNVIFEIKK